MENTSAKPADIRASQWAVIAMFVLNGALFGIWASRIPTVVDRFVLEPSQLGLLLLLMGGGAIAGFPLAGHWVDRLGAARVTLGLAVAYGASLVLIGLAPTLATLALALFLFGATHGGMDVAMNGWAGAVERHLPRPMMSRFHATWSLGAGLGAVSGYLALRLDLSLMAHAFIAGGLFAVLALGIAWRPALLPLWRVVATPNAPPAPLFLLPKGTLLLVGVMAMCSSIGEGAMADWSAIFLVEVAGAQASDAAIGYAVFSVAMVAMRLMGDRFTHHLGPVNAARLAGLIAATGALLAVLLPGYISALVGFLLMGVGYAVIMPLAFSRAANDPVLPPGKAIAAMATLGYGGLLLGPVIIGFVAGVSSIQFGFGLLVILALLVILLAPALAWTRRAQ